jgi:integrase
MNGLIRFFGYDRDVSTITHEDAHQYRKWLDERRIRKSKQHPKGFPLAENTKRKHIDNAKVFFNGAKRRGLIQFNPFEYQTSSTKPNRERDYFLTVEQTERILANCPDAEWRLLVALWRFSGIRKMEVFGLTWGDVLKDKGRMRVHATKTAHHEGKDVRYVPLRDIQEHLEDVFQEQLPDGKQSLPPDAPIITRFSRSNSNLDKPFKAILHRAGILPWQKLFQNMRASCETQWLNEGHPVHVVAAWIGHSVKVQRDSYAQITDGHYDKFNSHPTSFEQTSKSGLPGGLEGTRTDEKSPKVAYPVAYSKPSKNADDQFFPYSNASRRVAVEGLEPPTRGL